MGQRTLSGEEAKTSDIIEGMVNKHHPLSGPPPEKSKEYKSLVNVVGDISAIVGKCNMCRRNIENDEEKFWCVETRLINGKFFCGGCLLELHDFTETVYQNYVNRNLLERQQKGTYFTIDEATGKIVTNNG